MDGKVEGHICPFCCIPEQNIIAENNVCIAFRDIYPVSTGHTLIVPKRHVSDFFELSDDEMLSMLSLLKVVKANLDSELHPEGYNVGVNVGKVAGQSVFHVHMHLIPRYSGDMDNPKGGVRGVIPHKMRY